MPLVTLDFNAVTYPTSGDPNATRNGNILEDGFTVDNLNGVGYTSLNIHNHQAFISYQDLKNGDLKFADRLGVAAGAAIADRQRAMRRGGVETVGAGAARLLLDQCAGGGDASLDLPRCVERRNA